MIIEDKQILRQILTLKYFLHFWMAGFQRFIREKKLIIAALLSITGTLLGTGGYLSRKPATLMKILVPFYIATFVLITGLVIALVFWRMGLPKDFLAITFNVKRIGLVNSLGEIPILMERKKDPVSRSVERWIFETYGIPFSAWTDAAENIESAFDVALVNVEEGASSRCVELTVVLHPGPWPRKIEWGPNLLSDKRTEVVLGTNRSAMVTVNLSQTPHFLIAGRTGSGKTVLVKMIILQALWKGMTVSIIDYKRGVDYSAEFQDRCSFADSDEKVISVLEALHMEMETRLEFLKNSGYPNIDSYNKTHQAAYQHHLLVIDEIAECLEKTGVSKDRKLQIEKIEKYISSIARLGRAAGINLILATQRGSADVLTGQIRSNVYKICGICDDNLSILTLGNVDAAKRIPSTAVGRFLTEENIMFQGFYSDFSLDVFP